MIPSTTISQVSVTFQAAFAAAEPMPYNPDWANGTGYCNGAIRGEHAPKLAIGQIVAAQSPMPNDRKIVIVGTPLGNVAVFQRYSGGDSDVYVFNSTSTFNTYFGSRFGRPLTADDMEYLVGDPAYPSICPNIGTAIETLRQALATFDVNGERDDVQ